MVLARGCSTAGEWRARVAAAAVSVLVLASKGANAHERFIKHRLKVPLHEEFFRQGPGPMGINSDLLRIATTTFGMLVVFMLLWYVREPLGEIVDRRVVRRVGGRWQRIVHQVAEFLSDRPVRARWFQLLREWCVILFLRSPGLVLMYSATNDSLVMPSYPLDPASAEIFKFIQVGLAILILTQTALPLCGAAIFGTWIYLFRWGWMVAVDAMPVLTVAVVYVTSPWQSHKLAITDINAKQMRWLRITLGIGFLALGWLKLYNHDLTAGVADNFPSIMSDPMVTLLKRGTSPDLPRETWVAAFGMAEVMSGFFVLAGVFSRVWMVIMTFVFTKLMLVDFGWHEIPHIYPISAMLAVMTSNRLTSEFDRIERIEVRLGRSGKSFKRVLTIVGASVVIAFLVIFPMLYVTTFLDRSKL